MHTLVTTHYLKYAAPRVRVLGCRLCCVLVPAAVLRSCGLRREGVRAPLTC
jgi:hypothetical protein